MATARAEDAGPDTLLLLEHHPVYTAGRRTEPDERPTDGTPVIDVDRGGKITWHGPGQLVGYPIVKLADPIDVVNYVRRLEEALIAVCDRSGVHSGPGRGPKRRLAPGRRPPPRTQDRRDRHPRTARGHHARLRAQLRRRPGGLRPIVPCGIRDAGVTSLRHELDRDVTVEEVLPMAREAVLAALEGELPVNEDRWLPAPGGAEGPRRHLRPAELTREWLRRFNRHSHVRAFYSWDATSAAMNSMWSRSARSSTCR